MERSTIDFSDLKRLYESGISVKQLSEHYGISRCVIVTRLHEIGITQRNRSESMFLRMSQTTPEERRRLTSAAHASIRGKRQTEEFRCKVASGIERSGKITRLEELVISDLKSRGISDIVPQKAIGRYNVDIALCECCIAVEIYGGNWHTGGRAARRFRERFDYLLNCGWTPVIIWISHRSPFEAGATDYIVSLVEKIRRGEAIRCEEHMIRGDGCLVTHRIEDLNDRTRILCHNTK